MSRPRLFSRRLAEKDKPDEGESQKCEHAAHRCCLDRQHFCRKVPPECEG
jgi:hypothetical protein